MLMSKKIIACVLAALCFALPAEAAKTKAKKADTASSGNVEKAKKAEKDADLVVATVNGIKITLSELEAAHAANPQINMIPLENIYEPLLDNIIQLNVVASEARNKGLQDDPDFQKLMKESEKQMLARYFLEKTVQSEQTKDKLAWAYEHYLEENPRQEEMSAAHILLKTEDEAKDVIKQLEKGADFAELANKLSENKGLTDGDLGYFSRDLMVPEFSEAAFAMKEGEISKKPVKTKFGYHVIKAGPHRFTEPPKIEEVREEVLQIHATAVIETTMKALNKKAKIDKVPVKFDKNGKVTVKKKSKSKAK